MATRVEDGGAESEARQARMESCGRDLARGVASRGQIVLFPRLAPTSQYPNNEILPHNHILDIQLLAPTSQVQDTHNPSQPEVSARLVTVLSVGIPGGAT